MKKWFIVLCAVCIMTSCMVLSVSAAEKDFSFDVDTNRFPYWIQFELEGAICYFFTEYPCVISEIDGVGAFMPDRAQYISLWMLQDDSYILADEGWMEVYDENSFALSAVFDSNYIEGFPSYEGSNVVEYPDFPSYNRSDYPYYFLFQDSGGDYNFYISSKPFAKSQYANAYCVDAGANYVVYRYNDDTGWYISGNSTTIDGGMCIPFDGNTMITSNHIDGYVPEDIGLLNSIGKLFTSALTWVGTVASTMVSNPILLCFLVLPIAFIGVGLFRRIKD